MFGLHQIRVRSLKALADVTLELGGLKVLVGDNGAGKSTLLEALEMLRVCTEPTDPLEHFQRFHGGLPALLRQGESSLGLEAAFTTAKKNLFHSYAIQFGTRPLQIEREVLRKINGTTEFDTLGAAEVKRSTELSEHRVGRISVSRSLREILAGIDVHLPFDVTAGWATQRYRRGEAAARKFNIIDATKRLEPFGSNLASAYHGLKNEMGAGHWRETLELIQLGLGRDIIDVSASASPGGGHVGLIVEFASLGRVPAFALADGVLTYLAFVALVRLDEGRTLLAFDEPETHLHPALLARVVGLLEDAATRYPVVLVTHSDRLLDCLADPVESVVVCELDKEHSTKIRRLDPVQYDKWRDDFRGVGEIRAEGQLSSILAEP